MKKACLVVSSPYTNGEIFNKSNTVLNRDNVLAFFHYLKDFFSEKNIDLNTQDINMPDECDFVIYNEMPNKLPRKEDVKKSFLLLFESELIRPDNWQSIKHNQFAKIFTWNDEFVDNKRYFKFNLTHLDQVKFLPFENRKKLCTLIAGNKSVSHKLELYSERKKAIRRFEQNHPEDFEFYGMGWNEYTFTGPVFIRVLNKIPGLRGALAGRWPSYRGPLVSKLETLKNYKFSICFENAKGIPGYITEKIFDSFAAGCVPVYWGAPNISDHVPESCFIDKRKFQNYDELYRYLSSMTAKDYNKYLESITEFLQSSKHSAFDARTVARSVCNTIATSDQ